MNIDHWFVLATIGALVTVVGCELTGIVAPERERWSGDRKVRL